MDRTPRCRRPTRLQHQEIPVKSHTSTKTVRSEARYVLGRPSPFLIHNLVQKAQDLEIFQEIAVPRCHELGPPPDSGHGFPLPTTQTTKKRTSNQTMLEVRYELPTKWSSGCLKLWRNAPETLRSTPSCSFPSGVQVPATNLNSLSGFGSVTEGHSSQTRCMATRAGSGSRSRGLVLFAEAPPASERRQSSVGSSARNFMGIFLNPHKDSLRTPVFRLARVV
ncbi:hypothetical protein BDV19DRAFT_290012 [Aspergillus venezuelensis]